MNNNWMISFDFKTTNNQDSIYFIDWRSNSSTGHMHIAYNPRHGVYFSDRTINGIYGSSVRDTMEIANDTWVHVEVTHTGDTLEIKRNGARTAAQFVGATISPISTTTIGYSEDFRYAHASFSIVNMDLYGVASPIAPVLPAAPTNLALNPSNRAQEISIELTWTDNATDEDGFTIERSTDGSNWTEIMDLGDNLESYNDLGLVATTMYYYRVRAYNANGTSAYSNEESVTTTDVVNSVNDLDVENIKIFPNPSNGSFNIAAPVNTEINIFNVLGVRVQSFNTTTDLLKVNLNAGVYFVQIDGKSQKVIVK